MKIVLINKSDCTGGAAVVSLRLTEALRDMGHEATLLVVSKGTTSPYVEQATSEKRALLPFLRERLSIYLHNGFNRGNLFRVDTASAGLPLWKHPLVRQADAVILGWVNQGMLSLRGVRKICGMGKPVLWMMHDMWCATGICHHSLACERYLGHCGECPFLTKKGSPYDLSHKVWKSKQRLYADTESRQAIHFVAVSSWLAEISRNSSLLADQKVHVIHNPFPLPSPDAAQSRQPKASDGRINILIAAARLDDPIKGWPIIVKAMQKMRSDHPAVAERIHLTLAGTLRNEDTLKAISVSYKLEGIVAPENMPALFASSDITLSASLRETLPGTLVEAQAAGSLPVAFDSGGQRDIIDHGQTGILASLSQNEDESASNLSAAIIQAIDMLEAADRPILAIRLYENVRSRFSAEKTARKYIDLIESIRNA